MHCPRHIAPAAQVFSCLQARVRLFVLAGLLLVNASLRGQTTHSAPPDGANPTRSGTAMLEGRVLNGTSGSYLNNATVTIDRSTIEVFTNENGEYRVSGLPPGEVRVAVSFTGFNSQTSTLVLTPGRVTRHDFELSLAGTPTAGQEGVVRLEAYTVEERELTGQAVALHERRNAPNIKNVVSLEEFGDMGEGNIGEFLKRVPGLDIGYNPEDPASVSIRGMPATGTLVMFDGVSAASSAPSQTRQFDLTTAMNGNVERVEVTKTPTPDMPANAVGGSVNVIAKRGFSRKRPLFSYNLFGTYNSPDGLHHFNPRLREDAGPDPKSTFPRVSPSFNLSYIAPVNDSVAFTLGASHSLRHSDWLFLTPTWDKVALVQTREIMNQVKYANDSTMATGTMDWKIFRHDLLRVGFTFSKSDLLTRQHQLNVAPGANATGGPTFVQGASTGVGTAIQAFNDTGQHKHLQHSVLSYQHDGTTWKIDGSASYSRGGYKRANVDDGFFSAITTTGDNYILRLEGLDGITSKRIPRITATTRSGAPVDLTDAKRLSVTGASSSNLRTETQASSVALNFARPIEWAVPVSIKAGGLITRDTSDATGGARSWSFNPPGGAAGRLVTNFDLVAQDYSNRVFFTDISGTKVRPQWLSPYKMYQIYRAHPEWFTLNETTAYTGAVNAAQNMVETVMATYFRTDVRLLNNRLWIVGGVRFEGTRDEGEGPLNDISAIYVRDARGNFVRGANGALVRVTTDALANARLQFTRLGARAERRYDGYYPSLNASYTVTDAVVVRGAYARTIGRPDLGEIVPGTSITDPNSSSANRTITVVNTGLRPWTSDNYDLTAEAYHLKGAVASVSLFRKDITKFFTATSTPATPALLEQYGLSTDYTDYEIATKTNSGSASISGLELSYRQSLEFLPAGFRGLQLYAGFKWMELTGENAADFTDFSPRDITWGASYVHSKFVVKLNVARLGEVRRSPVTQNATTPAGTYSYRAAQTRIDVSLEYRLSKKFSLYANVRNLRAAPVISESYNPGLPAYARPVSYQYIPAAFTFGFKGDF